MIGIMLFMFLSTEFSGISWAKNLDCTAIGVRVGMNFHVAGLHPGEIDDFEHFDLFGILGLL